MRSNSFWLSDHTAGWLLITPYLIAFIPLLLWPFMQGLWMSLHDWNLLAVTFNPDAREFIGLGNYVNLIGGDNLGWSFTQFAELRLVLVAIAAFMLYRARQARVRRPVPVIPVVVLLFVAALLGLTGNWYDPRFWIVVRNTL